MFEVIYQTRETVFHRDIQTPRRELKIRRAAEYFWRNLRCLDSIWNTASSKVKLPKSMIIKTGYPNLLHGCDFLCFDVMNYLWVWEYLLLISIDRFLRFYFFVFSLVGVLIETINQTLKILFHHISMMIKIRQKFSTVYCFFNSLLGVWTFGQTRSHVFRSVTAEKS